MERHDSSDIGELEIHPYVLNTLFAFLLIRLDLVFFYYTFIFVSMLLMLA
jgi:hypothetical protein